MARGDAPVPLVGDFCVFVSREDPFRNPQCCTIARIRFFASSCSIHRNSGRSAGSPVRLLRDLFQRKISSVPAFGLFKAMRLRFGVSLLRKQKSRHFCNFFAIADCCELPNCGLRRKSAGNRLHDGLFSLCGDGRESVIAKKLQRCRNFCFHGGRIAPTGRFRNGRIAETGQIMQMCGFSLAASRSGLGLPSDGAAACALPHWEGLAKWSGGASRGALRLAE